MERIDISRKNDIKTLVLQDFISRINVNPSTGLTREDAIARRALYGSNRVTPPLQCPSWICCLLPCVTRIPSMVAYRQALPIKATVRRQSDHFKGSHIVHMSPASLVYGDVVEIYEKDVVPADLRVIKCSYNCVVDQAVLLPHFSKVEKASQTGLDNGDQEESVRILNNHGLEGDLEQQAHGHLKQVSVWTTNHDSLKSCNILLMGTRVINGTATGVVIATGDQTQWGQLISLNRWP
uniref:Carbohydratebinding protein putative n=1 Tax=Albugo laibachii Nc14 TaxID=890382 RepID=F0WN24_9STRA|nr:carbohydratebinding protein putative [Albugo laibachii Nc14]|eukprot:CCA22711.1 carbohydratebinding protein putative [Albugo laibachii Nc14]